ncbi:MAG TPA: TolC family protein [Gemmatimonadales bacterium]|nr:TolC family protein [Gemmatimonadales bacterium]
MAVRRPIFAALVVAFIGTMPLVAQDVERITLAEALRRSELVNPSIVSAQGTLRSRELAVRSSTWQYLPQITFPVGTNFTASSGQSRLDPVTGEVISGNTSNFSYQLGARASYTIFDGFGRTHDLRAAQAQEVAAEAQLVSARFQNSLQVTNAFFDALAAQELLKVNEAAVDRARQQLAVASARMQAGAGQRTDSLTALVQLGQARQQLLQAQASLATAEANLARWIGQEGRVEAVDDQSFYRQPELLDTASVRREAELASPTVRASEQSLAAARSQLRSQRSNYWPTVTAEASNIWTAQRSSDYELIGRRQLNLGLSFSPWTSLQRETQIENASIAVDNAEAQLADQRRQISASLTQYYASLANAREAIEVAQISVSASEENVRVTEQRYRLGVATVFELTQAQEQLTSAQVNEVTARFSYIRAKAQIEALIGRTL